MDTDTATGTTPGSWRRLVLVVALCAAVVLAGLGAELAALVVLLSLILLHEAGHYLAARATGMRVEQFFVGFGPVVWSVRRGGIEYGMKAVPLGGYVKIAGMGTDDEHVADGYQAASRLRRLVVVAAGPATNLLIALVVGFVMLFAIGVPHANTTVDSIDPRLGAASAGIRPGDVLHMVDGLPVTSFADITTAVERAGVGGSIALTVERGENLYMFDVPVALDVGAGRIGIQVESVNERLGVQESASGALTTIASVANGSLRGIGQLIAGFGNLLGGLVGNDVDPANRPLSPVGAVQVGAEIGGRGLFEALQLIVVYSTFLAVFNLLPVPPLDGGRMFVVGAEAVASVVRRRPVRITASAIQRVGTAFALGIIFVGIIALILDITQPVLR